MKRTRWLIGGILVALSKTAFAIMLNTGTQGTNLSNSVTNYFAVSGPTVPTTTEATMHTALPAFVPQQFCCLLGAAPGSGNSYTFTLRNGGSDTDWVVAITDSSTEACDAVGSAYTETSQASISSVPASTPTATTATCSIIGKRVP